MVDLLDLVPAADDVAVGDKRIAIFGIELTGIAAILNRYPAIVDRFQRHWEDAKRAKATGEAEPELRDVELVALLGPALPAVIAAGCGYLNDEARERAVTRLPMDMQIDLVAAIMKRTMPDGLGPFMERIKKRFNALQPEAQKPRKPGLRVRSMKSRPPRSG